MSPAQGAERSKRLDVLDEVNEIVTVEMIVAEELLALDKVVAVEVVLGEAQLLEDEG